MGDQFVVEKPALSFSWRCPCRLLDHSGSLAASSTPTGQPQQKPTEQICHACSGVLPAVVVQALTADNFSSPSPRLWSGDKSLGD